MNLLAIQRSRQWFKQAESDARVAKALLQQPKPLKPEDVGCHVVAMCAQAIEKSLKGYLFLNRATPAMNHRPDKYLSRLLNPNEKLLWHTRHRNILHRLFNPETKARVRELLDLTPGGLGYRQDVPNTEYPWSDPSGGRFQAPAGNALFLSRSMLKSWLDVTLRVSGQLAKLAIEVEQASVL